VAASRLFRRKRVTRTGVLLERQSLLELQQRAAAGETGFGWSPPVLPAVEARNGRLLKGFARRPVVLALQPRRPDAATS